jgi:pyruvate kinase
MLKKVRQTKIVFTIGPATASEEVLTKLIELGVDVCRFNMAHASHDWFFETVDRVRHVCDKADRVISLMMDVKGPEIRTRTVADPILLCEGDLVEFSHQPSDHVAHECERLEKYPDHRFFKFGVNYPGFVADLQVGSPVLVDSGMIRTEVVEKTKTSVLCQVNIPGTIGSRRHINLPGINVDLPALTEKDFRDVEAGVKAGVDLFALSFVRQASDLTKLRGILESHGSKARIIAKIEDQSGIKNLESIIDTADGIMVARGDLGIEVPFEQLPIFQRQAVQHSLRSNKPVIIATHMLESMITSPVPTRAEITDVSNAVRELADCVMLSGETTVGAYPEKCVDVLNRIIFSLQDDRSESLDVQMDLKTPKEKLMRSCVSLAENLAEGEGRTAIIVFTGTGDLASLLSSMRPRGCPVFAFTNNRDTFLRMLMFWGVEPFMIDFEEDPEQTIHAAFNLLKQKNWAEVGDQMVIVTNVVGVFDKIVDSMQVRPLE